MLPFKLLIDDLKIYQYTFDSGRVKLANHNNTDLVSNRFSMNNEFLSTSANIVCQHQVLTAGNALRSTKTDPGPRLLWTTLTSVQSVTVTD